MSKLTLKELQGKLQNRSITTGWDAIVLYDQRAANELLQQHYVERFSGNDYIRPMDYGFASGDGKIRIAISGLCFSSPRLSFEDADPQKPAVARLTLDMVSGLIVTTNKDDGRPRFIESVFKCLPLGSPQLYMSQAVTKAQVGSIGDVVIDMRNADNFVATFDLSELSSTEVGRYFATYFQERLPPEQKVFPLGTLSGDLSGPLAPTNFEIRLVKSEPLAVFGSAQYGDGAVMLCVTLKGGVDGKAFPGDREVYLIPGDDEGKKFTGALYLSNRFWFDKILRAEAMAKIAHGLKFENNKGENDIAWELAAIDGSIDVSLTKQYPSKIGGLKDVFSVYCNPLFKADVGGAAFTIRRSSAGIESHWAKSYSLECLQHVWVQNIGAPVIQTYFGKLELSIDYHAAFDFVLDRTTGVIHFTPSAGGAKLDVTINIEPFGPHNVVDHAPTMEKELHDYYWPLLYDALNKLVLPPIDTFLARNLLFPGENALQLSDAFIPGDLTTYGQLDPLRTTCVLSPQGAVVEAGTSLQFSVSPPMSDMFWSAREVHGDIVVGDVISLGGRFTAPRREQLSSGAATILVTAQGTVDGRPVQASAIVSVMEKTLAINPLIAACSKSSSRELTAESIDGSALEWKILTPQFGGRLDPVDREPNKRKYTAGDGKQTADPFYLDQIEVACNVNNTRSTAIINVVVANTRVQEDITVAPHSDASTGRVTFEVLSDGISEKVDEWAVIAGSGTISSEGVFTQPEQVRSGDFAVVQSTRIRSKDGKPVYLYALLIVLLPLTEFVKLVKGDT